MALEGVATVVLTDVKTGEVQKVTEKNMVTNALKYLFGQNIGNIKKLYGADNQYGIDFLPIFKNALGGILLFDDVIEENVETIYPASTANCIAYSSNDGYSGVNPRRGSLNSVESEVLSDGIKLVFDFATSQGNGTIKCLSLTHANGGKAGYGYDLNLPDINDAGVGKYNWFPELETIPSRESTHHFYTENYMYYYKIVGTTEIQITEYENRKAKISLSNDIMHYNEKNTYSFKPSFELNRGTYGDLSSQALNSNKLYFFQVLTRQSLGVIEFSLDSHTYSEKEVTFSNIPNIDFSYAYYSVVINDYLYLRKDDTLVLYKLNLNNPTDVKEIILPAASPGYESANVFELCDINGRIYGNNFVIDGSDNVLKMPNAYSHYYIQQARTHNVYKGMFYYKGFFGNSSDHGGIRLFTPYLATINNLTTPVVKTADKTMKITYILREVK